MGLLCSFHWLGNKSSIYFCPKICAHTFFGLSTACVHGEVLLYNGSEMTTDMTEGTVLVCYNNTYGTVCDDRWDSIDASIVCGQLGYSNSGKYISSFFSSEGSTLHFSTVLRIMSFVFSLTFSPSCHSVEESIPVRQSFYGSLPNHTTLLDDLVCTGNEDNLLECPRMPDAALGVSDCTHSEDAGVRCGGM